MALLISSEEGIGGGEMASNDIESFVHWQTVTRDHFSSVSNLVLGLATGLLAFVVSGFPFLQLTSKCLLFVSTGSMLFLAASIGLAVWCAINRLRDFRATAQIARSRSKGESVSPDARYNTKVLGRLSWRLFWWQLILFVFGATGVSITAIARLWTSQ